MPILELLAGAAMGNRDASNLNTELHNKEVLANRESQEKRWLHEANRQYEEYKAQRQMDREDQKYERDRADKIADKEEDRKFQLDRDKFKHDQSVSLENMRESGRNARAAERNALREKSILAKSGTNESGAKISDLRNLRNDAANRVENINKMLHDPMNANMDESRKASLLSELDRAERARGDLTFKINQAIKGGEPKPLNLQGLLNNK